MMDRILWTAGYTRYPIDERIAAAAASGYSLISIPSIEMVELASMGTGALADLRRRAEDQGVAIAVLDPVVTWLPVDPQWALARASLNEIERIGDILRVSALCVIAGRDHGLEHADVVERFGTLCDLASRHGWTAALEFAPGSGAPTFASAVRIVSESDRRNATVLFDTRHFYRAGEPLSKLVNAPAGIIRYVQISDTRTAVVGSIGRDAYNRLPPGQGDIDLIAVLSVLRERGELEMFGPEVIRSDRDETDCKARVAEDTAAMDAVLAEL
ncbi:MAG: Xylose isomerase protein barrel [Microbacteriaceae bacterium]|nr:Xylose isomerase protein barrel [Microbacteriaceae bacterium]